MSTPADDVDATAVAGIASCFAIDGVPARIDPQGAGHINDTYFVATDRGARYVLQRINPRVFPDPVAVITNTARVTAHVGARAPGLVPGFVHARDGAAAVVNALGAWRITAYVAGGEIGRAPLDPLRARAAGAAFGRLQAALADYPVASHIAPIPGFLELAPQYRALDAVLSDASADPTRRSRAATAIAAVQARRDVVALGERGPIGVIHADCKVSNVLFARGDDTVLAVIDLDTVMVGRRAWDFGDLVRSAAARGGEDTPGLAIDLARFAELATGFASGLGDLYDADLRSALVTAPRYLTLTLAVRFLVDYLAGDRYFRVDDPRHNLRRAQAQLALAESEERAERDMERLLGEL